MKNLRYFRNKEILDKNMSIKDHIVFEIEMKIYNWNFKLLLFFSFIENSLN